MKKKYSSLSSNTTLGFNKKEAKKISSANDFKIMNASWFFMILLVLSITTVQKATAKHFTNLVFNTSYTYHNAILKSSVAEGRGGGGGHGNGDLVKRHPLDGSPLDIITKDYNNNDYITHTLFNTIL